MDIKALGQKAQELRNSGQIKLAVVAHTQLAKLYRKNKDKFGEAEAYHMRGICYKIGTKSRKDKYFKNAMSDYERAEKIFKEIGNEMFVGMVLRDKGITYSDVGMYSNAYKMYEKSIQITQKYIKEEPSQTGITYIKYGETLMKEGKYTDARKSLDKGLKITEWWFFKASGILIYAQLLYFIAKYTDAIKKAEEALKMFYSYYKKDPQPRRLAETYGLLEACFIKLNKTKDAEDSKKNYLKYIEYLDTQAREVVENYMKRYK